MRLLHSLLRITTIGAWLFALGTLLILVVIIARMWNGATEPVALLSVVIDEIRHVGIGMQYQDTGGTVLAWSQATVVLLAIIASVLPWLQARSIGHLILLIWSILWFGNAVWMARIEPGMLNMSDLLAWVFGALFLCTLVRTVRGLGTKRPGRAKAATAKTKPKRSSKKKTVEPAPETGEPDVDEDAATA